MGTGKTELSYMNQSIFWISLERISDENDPKLDQHVLNSNKFGNLQFDADLDDT